MFRALLLVTDRVESGSETRVARQSGLCWTGCVYPGTELLQEVGRVTIAGSRLDVKMGMLWHHLDRTANLDYTRRASGEDQCKQVHRLAEERLTGNMHDEVLAAVLAARAARKRRNEIVHQDWVLRGREGMRSVSAIASIPSTDLPKYLEEWERESMHSEEWQRVPAGRLDVVPAQTLDELREVERELAAATDSVSSLTYRVASSRETGRPTGYVHPI